MRALSRRHGHRLDVEAQPRVRQRAGIERCVDRLVGQRDAAALRARRDGPAGRDIGACRNVEQRATGDGNAAGKVGIVGNRGSAIAADGPEDVRSDAEADRAAILPARAGIEPVGKQVVAEQACGGQRAGDVDVVERRGGRQRGVRHGEVVGAGKRRSRHRKICDPGDSRRGQPDGIGDDRTRWRRHRPAKRDGAAGIHLERATGGKPQGRGPGLGRRRRIEQRGGAIRESDGTGCLQGQRRQSGIGQHVIREQRLDVGGGCRPGAVIDDDVGAKPGLRTGERTDLHGATHRQLVLAGLGHSRSCPEPGAATGLLGGDELARAGKGLPADRTGEIDRRRRDHQRAGVMAFVIADLGRAALLDRRRERVADAEIGLGFGKAIFHADIHAVGIGLADIDQATIGGDQLAGAHQPGGIVDPAPGNVDRGSAGDIDVRRRQGIGRPADAIHRERDIAAPGHQFVDGDRNLTGNAAGLDQRRADPGHAIRPHPGNARVDVEGRAVERETVADRDFPVVRCIAQFVALDRHYRDRIDRGVKLHRLQTADIDGGAVENVDAAGNRRNERIEGAGATADNDAGVRRIN